VARWFTSALDDCSLRLVYLGNFGTKQGIVALTWVALGGAFIACSGVASKEQQPSPPPDVSSVLDGGPDASQPSLSGCLVDDDCAQGVCDANQKQCVECRVDSSCAKGERCSDGHCVDARPCTEGSYSCDGQTLFHCSADGELEFSRDCGEREYCDPRRAQCQPQICKPGEASCDGAKIQVCSDDGSELIPKQLCSLAQVCTNGECRDIGCVPNSTFCSDGSVWKCGPDGTTSEPTDHCTASQYCLEKEHTATCSASACFASDALCVGNFATQCKPDGSGPKPGGSDCGAANQICYEGECRDPVCTPGLKLCDGNSLYLCSEAGTGKTLIRDCTDEAACDAATGACLPRICEPGRLDCDSTRVVTCNPQGTGWLQSGPDCATSHALCGLGTCKPIICSPGQYQCKDDSSYICSDDGTTLALNYNCTSSGYHCIQSGTYANCSPYYCQPGATGCNGNLLTTCKADGNGWVAGGTDCSSSNSVCSDSSCKPKICASYSLFCANGNVQQCDYYGLSSYQAQVCGYGSYCKAQGTSAGCVPTPCVPDTDGCAGEKYGHCASDGMSLGDGATDCAAASKVCTAQGCATTAIDTIASPNSAGAVNYYNLVLDTIDVQSSRKLSEIEVYLSLPTSRTLTFAVYQANIVNSQTTYDLKFQKVVSATGSGFQSSGAISFKLEAGKTYALGVSVTGGSFAYYYDAAATPPALNFALVRGGFASNFATSLSYGNPSLSSIFHLRLTTSLP